jgi:hypothetical protein
MIFTHPQVNSFMKQWRINLLDGKPGYSENNTLDMSLVTNPVIRPSGGKG